MKRGVIFTLDATLAVVMALSLILSSLFYLSTGIVSSEEENLYKLSIDCLSVLEKNDILKSSISTNTKTLLEIYLNSLPYSICARVEISNKNNVKLLTALKNDCTYSENYLVSRRVFTESNSIYLAKMEAWYK